MIDKTSTILDRIKEKEGFSGYGSEAELARFLGIRPQTLNTWRGRESLDFDKILQKCKDYDLNWLFTGHERGATTEIGEKMKVLEEQLNFYKKELEKTQAKVDVLKEVIEDKKKYK